MRAIEFQARVKDGVIEIPEAYRTSIGEVVRVIILTAEHDHDTGIIARLLEHPIQDPAFTPLSRDEVYQDRSEKHITQ